MMRTGRRHLWQENLVELRFCEEECAIVAQQKMFLKLQQLSLLLGCL